ncbi:MAG TPA: hypothetical protein PLD58_19125 [Phycisphaerae bacterium]|nr:hypothetical protein [Phycisphaerae bacterium]
MGFDLFVSCFSRGEPAGIPRQHWLDAFAGFISDEDSDVWHVEYDQANSCDIHVTPDPNERDSIRPGTIASAMIERPCEDQRLWDALSSVMRLGNVVLYYPGSQALVACASVAEHLPEGMADALGGVVCIASGEDIVRYIRTH